MMNVVPVLFVIMNAGVRVAMVTNSFAQQLEMPTANNGIY